MIGCKLALSSTFIMPVSHSRADTRREKNTLREAKISRIQREKKRMGKNVDIRTGSVSIFHRIYF